MCPSPSPSPKGWSRRWGERLAALPLPPQAPARAHTFILAFSSRALRHWGPGVHKLCARPQNIPRHRFQEMSRIYEYDGQDTCAADGMCQVRRGAG